jgi:3-isopropylmalate/(R)-2-methylmalate dehydratase small subunit
MPVVRFEPIRSHYVVLAKDDIDTDQVIPARYLKTTERSGLGVHAFHDWRYDSSGVPRADFPLNDPRACDARVLVAGRNFGCGSSREHAVWALMAAGFRAVIATAFAEIFRGNALGNGLLPVEVDDDVMSALVLAAGDPRSIVGIDLASQSVTLPNGSAAPFPIAPFAKHCLLNGVDELDVLLAASAAIDEYEAVHPARIDTINSAQS